jgi:hypothetical protein
MPKERNDIANRFDLAIERILVAAIHGSASTKGNVPRQIVQIFRIDLQVLLTSVVSMNRNGPTINGNKAAELLLSRPEYPSVGSSFE